MSALGLDFGTTNSVVSRLAGDGRTAQPIPLLLDGTAVEAIRSAIYFWQDDTQLLSDIGPYAIRELLAYPDDGRFLQSMKTYAASASFRFTSIFGKRFQLEDILSAFLAKLLDRLGLSVDSRPRRVVIGRPVAFAGAHPDAQLAMDRYRAALGRLGFDDILFVYEPVAAAFHYARRLERAATALVADFGGGTSDFSIIRFETSGGALRAEPLACGGVGIAGDRFDYRLIDHVILPRLGKGGTYRSMGQELELPKGVFARFAQWNELSLLKTSPEFRDVKGLVKDAAEPEKLARFVDLVEREQGYALYRAVSEAKARLSSDMETEIVFSARGEELRAHVTRRDFESWIAEDLAGIERALERTLSDSGLPDRDLDKVFLTGGASFVPAVRRLFETRFGRERIESGDELLAIANGLALIGARGDAERWAVAS
jgi:hypothetical chaperone protein